MGSPLNFFLFLLLLVLFTVAIVSIFCDPEAVNPGPISLCYVIRRSLSYPRGFHWMGRGRGLCKFKGSSGKESGVWGLGSDKISIVVVQVV